MRGIPSTQWWAALRARISARRTPVILILLAATTAILWPMLPKRFHSTETEVPMLHTVQQTDFVHDIIERGAVESASNIEVRCEVQSQNTAGTRILEVVPEGTYVKKGEVICKLDSSALDNDRLKQTSVAENANAAMIQAKSDHEYGLESQRWSTWKESYLIDKAQIQADLAVAEEAARRAVENVRYSRRLLEKGYITQLQLEADKFAAEKAEKRPERGETQARSLGQVHQGKDRRTTHRRHQLHGSQAQGGREHVPA